MKPWYILACAVVVVAGVTLAIVGNAWALVPVLGCALMMGAMVWMMMRGGGSG
jgi:hypothetical protein